MTGKPPGDVCEDPDAGYWEDEREDAERLEPGRPRGRRKNTNTGKTYTRRAPKLAEGGWTPQFYPATWQKLLSCKSWVVIGVMWALAVRAKSKGECEADQEEVAKEVGCDSSAVNRAYRKLETDLELIEQLREGHQGKFSKFEVKGYKKGSDRKPNAQIPQE